MIGLKFTSQFNARPVTDAVERARRKNLAYAGGYLRKVERSSLKVARQKRLSELTKPELIAYEVAKRKAAAEGRPAPKRPLVHSRPGDPPKLREGASSLKGMIFFAFDTATHSVVIGPAIKRAFSPTVPELLEHGGRAEHGDVQARPFAAPALDKTLPKFRDVWRDSVRV